MRNVKLIFNTRHTIIARPTGACIIEPLLLTETMSVSVRDLLIERLCDSDHFLTHLCEYEVIYAKTRHIAKNAGL